MNDIFDLTQYNTPVVQISEDKNSIFVKRDDLLPFSFGGNKVRIALEFINDMKRQGKNCVVGYGNARSNLSRALANLCCQFNIPCHIISPADEDGTRIDTYNSKMVLSCGAKFHYCKKTNVKETVESVLEELKKEGFDPYYIYGDSTGKGNEHIPIKAYLKVYEEIKNKYDYIFLATGTGMTQGGLLAGKAINNGKETIVGISVSRNSAQENSVIKESLDSFSRNIQPIGDYCEINVVDDYLCKGYGSYNRQIEKTIYHQFTSNGMPLDPTYTGKAFWGMEEYINANNIIGKKILFIHTGGTPLFFDFSQDIRLKCVDNLSDMYEAISLLEGNLTPSLSERNIDLLSYSHKINISGKAWCHYNLGQPVSIVAGYFNDHIDCTAYLTILAVAEHYRGKKLGRYLLAESEKYAVEKGMKKIKLEVHKNNMVAQRLYNRLGYCYLSEASDTSFYMIKEL